MPSKVKLLLRLGSHAEKEYFLKGTKLFDGIIIGANLLEATPGATASLLLKFKAEKKEIYIDPVTYSFGLDISYLKSEKKNKKTGKTTVQIKRTFQDLSVAYGDPFQKALQEDRSINPADFPDSSLAAICKSIGNYELNRVKSVFEGDAELKEFANNAPSPAHIFAPYFYSPENDTEYLGLNLKLLSKSIEIFGKDRVDAVFCFHRSLLLNSAFLTKISTEVSRLRPHGVWMWISDFNECKASSAELDSFRDFVRSISSVSEISNLHGGYFSLCLEKAGMSRISHGVGYGEHKDVIPVISGGVPTVRFHLPKLHRRIGIPEIERSFKAWGIESPEAFFEKVCTCIVCRGVIGNRLDNFIQFGDFYSPNPSGRPMQTPASAKRCRFQFMLARDAEIKFVQANSADKLAQDMKDSYALMQSSAALEDSDRNHLPRWASSLEGIASE